MGDRRLRLVERNLVYRTGDRSQEGLLTWFDRAGKVVGTVADSAARYQNVRILPDERHAVTHIHNDASGGGDIWKIDLETGTQTRLTTNPAHDENPVVSPDGAAVAWRSNRQGPRRSCENHRAEQATSRPGLP